VLALVDTAVRLAAAGGFGVLALAILASRPAGAMGWAGPVFFVTAAGHALFNCGLLRSAGADLAWLVTLTWALSALGAGFFWLFTRALFEDGRAIPPWGVAALVVQVPLACTGRFAAYPADRIAWTAFHAISLSLVGLALAAIWRSGRDDLVEPRRRLRAPVMAAAAAYVLLTIGTDLAETYGQPVHDLRLIQGTALFLLALGGAAALMRLDPALAAAAPRRAATADPAAAGALARLAQAMDVDEVWRREDLTIGGLAQHVGLPEHRLRRLINGELGHRNFAAFVNARRIAAAKLALRDPRQARTSISAIAYELGFGSLGPFNRAFKDMTGVTPSAWRGSAETPAPA
jgi:AraC-like DNA-binding protein